MLSSFNTFVRAEAVYHMSGKVTTACSNQVSRLLSQRGHVVHICDDMKAALSRVMKLHRHIVRPEVKGSAYCLTLKVLNF